CPGGGGAVNGDGVGARVAAATVGRAALAGGGIVRERDMEQVSRAAAVCGNSRATPSRGGSPGVDFISADRSVAQVERAAVVDPAAERTAGVRADQGLLPGDRAGVGNSATLR